MRLVLARRPVLARPALLRSSSTQSKAKPKPNQTKVKPIQSQGQTKAEATTCAGLIRLIRLPNLDPPGHMQPSVVQALALELRAYAGGVPEWWRERVENGLVVPLLQLAPRAAEMHELGVLGHLHECVAQVRAAGAPFVLLAMQGVFRAMAAAARILADADAAQANERAVAALDSALAARGIQRVPDYSYVPGDCGFDSVRAALQFVGHACPPSPAMRAAAVDWTFAT